MKEEFVAYVDSLDIAEPLVERINTIHDLYQIISPADFDHIFVTEVAGESGDRIFGSLWFFAGDYAMEAHDFATNLDMDGGAYETIDLWRAESSNYDFTEATDESRLSVRFTAELIEGALRASGSNCDALAEILKQWVVPRTLSSS